MARPLPLLSDGAYLGGVVPPDAMIRPLLLAVLLAGGPALAQAQPETADPAPVAAVTASTWRPATAPSDDLYDVDAAPAFYVVDREVPLRALPEAGAQTVTTLRIRDGVRVLDTVAAPEGGPEAGWRLVQYGDRRGYVPAGALSNVWIRVDKSERTVFVYRGDVLLRTLPADVSTSDEDKIRRSDLGETDHYRIPEGVFYVARRNDASQYYRAFVVSYPGPVHALRGLQSGLITQQQYEDIVRADQEGREPPMNTRLGGLIEIHGQGSGRRRAWTRGCVALRNVHMDELWQYVEVGTPIVIEP